METKICTKCNVEKDILEFRIRNKKKNTYQCWCKKCLSEYEKDVWRSSPERRKSNIEHGNKRRKRNGEFIAKYLADKKCKDCGEDDIVVLDFDHMLNKRFNISDACKMAYSIKTIMKEIEKCEIVCSNCHRRRTAKKFNYTRSKFGE